MSLIEPGEKAPAFTLNDQSGEKWSLSALKGRPVVLFFYPKDDTETCTKEACAFRDAHTEFNDLGAVLLGMSPQDEKSKMAFAGKHGLTYPILADDGAKVCQKYGVWAEKSMYGRQYMGVVRTTYLIGPDGKVAKRWDKVRVKGHIDDVLRAVRGLSEHAGRG